MISKRRYNYNCSVWNCQPEIFSGYIFLFCELWSFLSNLVRYVARLWATVGAVIGATVGSKIGAIIAAPDGNKAKIYRSSLTLKVKYYEIAIIYKFKQILYLYCTPLALQCSTSLYCYVSWFSLNPHHNYFFPL